MNSIYYLGGSPCSGKSTIAEQIAGQYDMHYFKIDDYLEKYLGQACDDGVAVALRMRSMTCDEMWLRDPETLMQEELEYYTAVFPYIMGDLAAIRTRRPIITEGAALLPRLMAGVGVLPSRYLCVVPDAGFQYKKYAERTWIGYILAESSDRARAFANWMERDERFALAVHKQADHLQYTTLVTTEHTPLAENIRKVESRFGLR